MRLSHRLTLAAVITLGLAACSQPEVRGEPGPSASTPPATAAPVSADPAAPAVTAAAPKRVPGLPQEQRDEIAKEYRELAKKNDCSRGFKNLDGTWRFAGETRTPNYTEILTIDGTKYTSKMTGDPDGKHLEATIEGRIRCLFKNRILVNVDKVTPEGAYDNKSNEDYPCDLLGDLAMTGNKMMMICYFGWDVRTAAGYEYEYERVQPE